MSKDLTKSIVLDRSEGKAIPLYEQIRCQLRERIGTVGRFRDGNHLPSISVMAKELDVNYRTIKAAYDLLSKEGLISVEPNKAAVIRRKNAIAAWNASQKLSISFVSCRHGDGYFVAASEGIKKFAQEHQMDYNMIDVGSNPDRFIETVTNPGPDRSGMLILPLERPGYAEAVRRAVENDMKIVLIDRTLPGIDVSSVESDHFTGAYLATNHLLKEHGLPVYYFGLTDKPSSCREWVRGWEQAMYGYNFCDIDSYCIDIGISEEELTDATDNGLENYTEVALEFFSKHKEEKYSFYTGNDFAARGIYAAAKIMGLKIGLDVFVVGYNDMPFASRFDVPLSSVAQLPSVEAVGYEAARLLYEHMLGLVNRPVRRLLPVELRVRQSSVCPESR